MSKKKDKGKKEEKAVRGVDSATVSRKAAEVLQQIVELLAPLDPECQRRVLEATDLVLFGNVVNS